MATTLRDLEYNIDANTKGLQSAIGVISNLQSTLQSLEKSVTAMGAAFAASSQAAATSVTNQAQATAAAAKITNNAQVAQQAALIKTQAQVERLNQRIKDAGGHSLLIANNTRAFNNYEKALKKAAQTGASTAVEAARFQKTLRKSSDDLNFFIKTQRQQTASATAAANAQRRQTNELARQQIAVERLTASLQGTKSGAKGIAVVTQEFDAFRTAMQGPGLDPAQFDAYKNSLRQAMEEARTGTGRAEHSMGNLNERMTDLAKSAQVALGPLSGIASRITAITSLANRSTIAIAGIIGAVIGFGSVMAKAIREGAEFERQFLAIEGVLAATGNQIGLTTREIENIVQSVGDLTLASEAEARDAAASLLTMRNVTKEIFEQSLLAAQGMANIARGDITSQIRRLGRLLEDPANNLKALTESGIFFNAMEERQIKLLQAAGDMAAAHAVIFARLEPVISGAKSETQGLAGAWDALGDTWIQFLQTAADNGGMLSTLTGFIRELNDEVNGWIEGSQVATRVGAAFGNTAKILVGIFKFTITYLDAIVAGFVALAAVKILSTVFGWIRSFQDLTTTLKNLGGAAGKAGSALSVLGKGGAIIGIGIAALEATGRLDDFGRAIGGLFNAIKGGSVRNADVFDFLDRLTGTDQIGNLQRLVSEVQNLDGVFNNLSSTINESQRDAIDTYLDTMVQNLTRLIAIGGEDMFQRGDMGSLLGDLNFAIEDLARGDINQAIESLYHFEQSLKLYADDAEHTAGVVVKLGDAFAYAALHSQDIAEAPALPTIDLITVEDINAALGRFEELRDEFSTFATEGEMLEAQLTAMSSDFGILIDTFNDGALEAGTYNDAQKEVIQTLNNLMAVGTPARRAITDITEATAGFQRETEILRASGDAREELIVTQEALNKAIEANIITTYEQGLNTEMLTDRQRDQIEMMKLLVRIQRQASRVADSQKIIRDTHLQTEALSAQLAIQTQVGLNDEEQAVAIARYNEVQKLQTEGMKEGTGQWALRIEAAEELARAQYALTANTEEQIEGIYREADAANALATAHAFGRQSLEDTALAQEQLNALWQMGLTNASTLTVALNQMDVEQKKVAQSVLDAVEARRKANQDANIAQMLADMERQLELETQIAELGTAGSTEHAVAVARLQQEYTNLTINGLVPTSAAAQRMVDIAGEIARLKGSDDLLNWMDRLAQKTRETIAVQRLELQMLRSTGPETTRLKNIIILLNAAMAAGVANARQYAWAIANLSPAMLSAAATALGLQGALAGVNAQLGAMATADFNAGINAVTEGINALNADTALAEFELGLVGVEEGLAAVALAGEQARVSAEAAIPQLPEGASPEQIQARTDAINQSVDAAKRLADLRNQIKVGNAGASDAASEAEKLAEAHKKAVEALEDQLELQARQYEMIGMTSEQREIALAIAEKEIELARTYGSLLDERAQKELALFTQVQVQAQQLQQMQDFADGLTDAFGGFFETLNEGFMRGEDMGEVFRNALINLITEIQKMVFELLILKRIKDAISGSSGGIAGSLFGAGAAAGGSSAWQASVTGALAGGFAEGGFIKPGTWGIVGEEGEEMAYGGRRGLTVYPNQDGESEGRGPLNIVFNVMSNTPETFRKTEGQVGALLSRVVQRGMRNR